MLMIKKTNTSVDLISYFLNSDLMILKRAAYYLIQYKNLARNFSPFVFQSV